MHPQKYSFGILFNQIQNQSLLLWTVETRVIKRIIIMPSGLFEKFVVTKKNVERM